MLNITSKKTYFVHYKSIFNPHLLLYIHAAVLDIAFTWNARCTMNSSQLKKKVLKMVVAMIWTIILPILYSSSSKRYTCYSSEYGSWLGEWCYSPYMVAVAIYLLTNALDMILFLVPSIGRYIETSNFRICTILSWWTQVALLHTNFLLSLYLLQMCSNIRHLL